MTIRLDYDASKPAGVKALQRVCGHIMHSGLPKALVFLRVSQIDGCAYCKALFRLRFRKLPMAAATFPAKRQMTEEKIIMKAIVVTDQDAGTAGMKLAERPEPQAAINDVVVQVHASGFTWDELTWPSTWTDRLGRDRTPVIPGQEL